MCFWLRFTPCHNSELFLLDTAENHRPNSIEHQYYWQRPFMRSRYTICHTACWLQYWSATKREVNGRGRRRMKGEDSDIGRRRFFFFFYGCKSSWQKTEKWSCQHSSAGATKQIGGTKKMESVEKMCSLMGFWWHADSRKKKRKRMDEGRAWKRFGHEVIKEGCVIIDRSQRIFFFSLHCNPSYSWFHCTIRLTVERPKSLRETENSW